MTNQVEKIIIPPSKNPETDAEWRRLQGFDGKFYAGCNPVNLAIGMAHKCGAIEQQRDELRQAICALRDAKGRHHTEDGLRQVDACHTTTDRQTDRHMSKQQEAKIRQNYVPKAIPQVCSTCTNYTCDSTTHQHAFGSYTKTSNQRCKIGGFAVKKTGTCDEWARAE